MRRLDPAILVLLGGISAAMHVGKLPVALPVLRDALGMTLLEAGFLLSLVQLAGMLLGLVVGLAADGLGLKRTMVAGLLILSTASLLGGFARDPATLMVLRAGEGLGFLLSSMPAPSLIRRTVAPERMSRALGLWGAYMPLGTAIALLCGPLAIAALGWQGWWWLLAGISAFTACWLWAGLPSDASAKIGLHDTRTEHAPGGWRTRLTHTLGAPGPWLVALSFAVYSAQWIAVIGFLPTVYAQAGLGAGLAGVATAGAAAVNMAGNIASGRLVQRGAAPHRLLYVGFAAMAIGAVLAFAPIWGGVNVASAAMVRYGAVLMFSMVGGLIPGTLFSLAVKLAPGEKTVSTTVGWAQQWSSIGQFAGPPLVAWVAVQAGGWEWSWLVTGGCASLGLLLAASIGALVRARAGKIAPTPNRVT